MTGAEPRIQIDTADDITGPTAKKMQLPFLDEFVLTGQLTIHFEAMGNSQFWIGVTDKTTGRRWHINCGAVRPQTKGYATIEEDTA